MPRINALAHARRSEGDGTLLETRDRLTKKHAGKFVSETEMPIDLKRRDNAG